MTTYYVVKQAPIFRHVIEYMFCKTERAKVSLDGLPGADGAILRLADRERAEGVQWSLIRHAETHLDEPQRAALAANSGIVWALTTTSWPGAGGFPS